MMKKIKVVFLEKLWIWYLEDHCDVFGVIGDIL